jgi:hypothetical protein
MATSAEKRKAAKLGLSVEAYLSQVAEEVRLAKSAAKELALEKANALAKEELEKAEKANALAKAAAAAKELAELAETEKMERLAQNFAKYGAKYIAMLPKGFDPQTGSFVFSADIKTGEKFNYHVGGSWRDDDAGYGVEEWRAESGEITWSIEETRSHRGDFLFQLENQVDNLLFYTCERSRMNKREVYKDTADIAAAAKGEKYQGFTAWYAEKHGYSGRFRK